MKLSEAQRRALALAAEGQLSRLPGGFWVGRERGFKIVALEGHGVRQDEPYVGTPTVRALERLGLLEEIDDNGATWCNSRVLTKAGKDAPWR